MHAHIIFSLVVGKVKYSLALQKANESKKYTKNGDALSSPLSALHHQLSSFHYLKNSDN